METDHRVHVGDARDLPLPADSVDLVVTSPPYPMIEMWDDAFAGIDPAVGEALAAGDGDRAYDLMHDVLDAAWAELERVVKPGGMVCVNVGDATRSIGDGFRQFPNHVTVTADLRERGFRPLPDILWRKPVNSPTKFMGSGTLPPNAYATLEHEHLLLFRNGERRTFPPGDDDRYESAFFWEERNEWFTDLWELGGAPQDMDAGLRQRSGAFPLEVPFRLTCMFSTYGDTVLDPFWGTGTTTLAAMCAGRDSVGVERDADLAAAFDDRVDAVPERSRTIATERLDAHREFVAGRRREGDEPGYDAEHYEFPVVTKQERRLRLYAVDSVRETGDGYAAIHEPV